MSLKANYFKLGLFVIGALMAGMIVLVIIGSGRWFQPKLTVETYFNESVQGLDIGSKLKYRGVAIGDVTKIGFSYNQYQLDKPMTQRVRYVVVEAQIQPKLLGGRAAAGDITQGDNAQQEVARGRDQLSRDRLCRTAAAVAADRLGAGEHLHPERAVHRRAALQRGLRGHGSAAQARHRKHGG